MHALILAEGVTARDPGREAEALAVDIEALRDAARKAAVVLGAEPPRLDGLPDNRLDGLALLDVIKPVEAVVAELSPDIVYTHHGGDLNIDHRVVHQATVTACRPLPGSPVRGLYAFETASSTEWASEAIGPTFRPTRYVDIGERLEIKLQALQCYATEMRPFPHARSIEAVRAQAHLRGAQVGLHAAEAFEVIREIAV